MSGNNFQFTFTTTQSPNEVFKHLLNPKNWWVGLFNETIEGKSNEINDEFSFKAGNGAHYTNHKLIELVTDETIVWIVTESNMTFLENPKEWDNTKICFFIEKENELTKVTFIHDGLNPQIECYNNCSSAWTQYLQKLKNNFN